MCASRALIRPDSSGPERSDFGSTCQISYQYWALAPIQDIFEGTAEIQQLVIARAISGMHIK
ncbi:MAG TPA: hypothetical protein VGF15_05700 [Solirubrobacteraceae bacterium]